MYRTFPYPYPGPFDALTAPEGSDFYILLYNLEHECDWNSINASYYGNYPLTILDTGTLAFPSLEPNTVHNNDSLFQQNFLMRNTCYRLCLRNLCL